MTGRAAPRIAYQPALDGLRAIAVTMVLLFHGDVGWMGGGYFGVSVFFTLSGFLITSLLVAEHRATDRIAPAAFYVRRLKRLLPASMVCLVAVSVIGATDGWQGIDNLRRDVFGALFQVANWVQLFAGESYTDLQSKNAGLKSPLDHYWSLAIEEQFYWVWPLAFWGMARMARRRGWSLTAIIGVLTGVFAAAAPVIAAVAGRDAAYWATPARAAEILLGALLAVALAEQRIRPRRWLAWAGGVVVVALAVVLPAAGGPAYHGAFPALALATTALLLGLQAPGLIATLLSIRPLVALGAISYGVYLFHFPVFVYANADRLHITGTWLLLAQLAITVAIATVSYSLIERPIRRGTLPAPRVFVVSALATAAVFGVAFVIPAGHTVPYYAASPVLAEQAAIKPIGPDETLAPLVAASPTAPSATTSATAATGATAAPTATTTVRPTSDSVRDPATTRPESSTADTITTPTDDGADHTVPTDASPPEADAATVASTAVEIPELSRPVRILVVGDSTAEATGAGLVAWAAEHPDLAEVSLAVSSGCGFVRGGAVPSDKGVPFQANCDELLDNELPTTLVAAQPDVVMLMVTSRDLVPRQWSEAEGLLTPADSRYAARIRRDYQLMTDVIDYATDARIVWIRPPKTDPYWLGRPHPFLDPELHRIVEDIIAETVAANPTNSQFLDLRAWMEADGIALDQDARPDGWHFSAAGGLYVAERWLGPMLLRAAAGLD